jgi:chemotaxis protein methyltransferase CheR
VDAETPPPPIDTAAGAATLYEAGRYEEAESLLRTSLESSQPAPEQFVLLARCLANQGRLAEALRSCDQALAADACNIAAQYLRALVLQEQGAIDEAALSLRRTLFLDPHFPLAHVALGTLARDQGDAHAARKHLHHALETLLPLKPTDVLPNGEGMTAGQLMNLIHALVREEAPL